MLAAACSDISLSTCRMHNETGGSDNDDIKGAREQLSRYDTPSLPNYTEGKKRRLLLLLQCRNSALSLLPLLQFADNFGTFITRNRWGCLCTNSVGIGRQTPHCAGSLKCHRDELFISSDRQWQPLPSIQPSNHPTIQPDRLV